MQCDRPSALTESAPDHIVRSREAGSRPAAPFPNWSSLMEWTATELPDWRPLEANVPLEERPDYMHMGVCGTIQLYERHNLEVPEYRRRLCSLLPT